MSCKLTNDHWEVLVTFMEKHPQFARGQFSGPSGKIGQKKMWEELAARLNSLGHGEKTTEKWQKVSFW